MDNLLPDESVKPAIVTRLPGRPGTKCIAKRKKGSRRNKCFICKKRNGHNSATCDQQPIPDSSSGEEEDAEDDTSDPSSTLEPENEAEEGEEPADFTDWLDDIIDEFPELNLKQQRSLAFARRVKAFADRKGTDIKEDSPNELARLIDPDFDHPLSPDRPVQRDERDIIHISSDESSITSLRDTPERDTPPNLSPLPIHTRLQTLTELNLILSRSPGYWKKIRVDNATSKRSAPPKKTQNKQLDISKVDEADEPELDKGDNEEACGKCRGCQRQRSS
ncbi:hypothetical protein BJ878DRAFT_476601 [Calycina marina]|uniref:Uncharacterized protein n=1 Tax=Calycina marina TaxID=1763456 RepID=A0A9P7ZA90_9HELO|nr:hypothetical protein BJ878DRAFT_476601 [Calycina marina]